MGIGSGRRRRLIQQNNRFNSLVLKSLTNLYEDLPPSMRPNLFEAIEGHTNTGVLGLLIFDVLFISFLAPKFLPTALIVLGLNGSFDPPTLYYSDSTKKAVQSLLNPDSEIVYELSGVNDLEKEVETGRLMAISLVFYADVSDTKEYRSILKAKTMIFRFFHAIDDIHLASSMNKVKTLAKKIIANKDIFSPQPTVFLGAYSTIIGLENLDITTESVAKDDK